MLQDIRYAIRGLARAPRFLFLVVLTIGIGIGAATAVFSVVDGVLLQPLPYPNADRIVRVWEEQRGAAGSTGSMTGNRWLSNWTYHAWLEHPRTIDTLGGYSSYEYPIEIGNQRFAAGVSPISPSLLSTLGVKPTAGRLFAQSEAETKAQPVAVVSESLWRGVLGGQPSLVGHMIFIDGEARRVVGVLPPSFHFPNRDVQVWVPLAILPIGADPAHRGATMAFTAIGRLEAGITREQAETEGTAAARSVPRPVSSTVFFGSGGGPVAVHVRPLATDMAIEIRPALLVLAVAVVLLLIVACGNVTNLLLSRGIVRQREIAVHVALGAGVGRVARQLLTESVALSALGGVVGVSIAWWLVRLTPRLAPAAFPRVDDISMDVRTLAFAVCASGFTALTAGLLPVLRGCRSNMVRFLHSGDGAAGGGFRDRQARWWRDTILMVEAALAIVLLVGMALLAHSFVRLTHVDAGYDADHVIAARVQLPRGATTAQAQRLIDSVLAEMRATPGVVAAGAGNMMPFVKMTAITDVRIPSSDGAAPILARALTYTITPGYAEALRLRLIHGRFFDHHDATAGVQPLLVNEEFVRQYLRSGAALGRRFDSGGAVSEVVGVVGDVLKDGRDRKPQPEIYFVHETNQEIGPFVNFVVRTSVEPSGIVPPLRETIRRADGRALIGRVDLLSVQLSESIAGPRFATIVLAVFAGAALALAALGLFSVLSYGLAQRRREFGVRAALGADRTALIALVLRDGLGVTMIGAAIGLAAAAALTRLMQAALFGVTPLDPFSFALAPAILLVVAAAACVLPARRAAGADPSEALRAE